MKKIKFPVLALFLTMLLSLGAAHPKSDPIKEIRWHPDLKLSWADFKGKPDRLSPMDALTESGISFTWYCDNRGFRAEIYALFVPEGSWVKSPTNQLLMHEQLHFDITELHARKMRQFFAEHPNPCSLGKAGIDKASKAIINASYEMQEAYDVASNHGQNHRKQREWTEDIAAQLLALEKYSD